MNIKKLNISIISDLHCHYGENGDKDTFLTSDLLRSPSVDHPVENLEQLIKKDKLKTDLTLCPGDFTNKSDKQGFISGWNYVIEINKCLKSKEIIATLGNHDVDSYEKVSNYNLEIAKGIKKGFPLIKEHERDVFWSKGCVFVERKNYRVLVINSAHFHYNKSNAESGKVDFNLLDYVKEYLDEKKDDKIKIALTHHQPIEHSTFDVDIDDKIINGKKLLELLGEYKFDLFIHGHKHDPLLEYYTTSKNNFKIPIFSSGSFSATSNQIFTGKKNNFHIIEMIKHGNSPSLGRIKTWTFMVKNGWKIVQDDAGFHPFTGFGFSDNVKTLADNIIKCVGEEKIYDWSDIVKNYPEVEYLIPSEADELTEILKNKKYLLSPKLSEIPNIISNASNLNL